MEYSYSKVSARAHPMLHDEAKADASSPRPIVLQHIAHLVSPTIVFTDMRVFLFKIYQSIELIVNFCPFF